MSFGPNGNRWWVAINSGSDSTFSGADPFGSPGNYQAVPSGNAKDDALFASAAGKKTTVSIEHILWQNVNGPFSSQAKAEAAIPDIQAKNPAPGILQQFNAPGVGQIGNIADFLARLTSGNLWLRVGEFILGSLLILSGALKLSGASSDIGDIVKTGAKVVK